MANTAPEARGRHGVLASALLAVSLVLAQGGALAHGCSHLRFSGETLHAPAAASLACAGCLAFAPVLAAAGGAGYSLNVARRPIATICRSPVAPLTALSPRHAFLSRGPPALA